MADQKRWFKVWTSITSDDDFDPQRSSGLLSLGRFSMLGAYTALHGKRGVVEVMPDTLLKLLVAHDLDELRRDLAFKNVSFEEGINRHGKLVVTWDKWVKYQEDSTQAERARASRSKRRGEETRGEETRREEIKTPLIPLLAKGDFASFWISYPKKAGRKKAVEAWNKINPDETMKLAILAALERHKQSRQWLKDSGEFIPHPTTWLNQRRWEDETGEESEDRFARIVKLVKAEGGVD